MPKIEINEKLFFSLLGKRMDYAELEALLPCAKAELDEKPDPSLPEDERVIKVELNDTNRPDLWSMAGLARQLRAYTGGMSPDYRAFMSSSGKAQDCGQRVVQVDAALKDIRPFMAAFVISGKPIDEPMLLDIIQTQEKLCWNFGRKRKSISMGIYRSAMISWPVRYIGVDPDKTSFVPLGCTEEMTCREILSEHPKGREYGWILKDAPLFPLLADSKGETLSMAPIINSATLGAVQVGDSDLLVEMTGTDMASLLLAINIVFADFVDLGYTILPVRIDHPYETGFGKSITMPCYFQKPVTTTVSAANRLLGSSLSASEISAALGKMGLEHSIEGDAITVEPPPYRNDFLHEVDIIEDIMSGAGVDAFPPESPRDFTIGRLLPSTLFARKVKGLMAGLGYQEMVFNYLGARRDFIEKMNIAGSCLERDVIEIANPMTENYQFVRSSILPSLLAAEAASGNAVYPHKVFEAGKVLLRCDEENTGARTDQNLGLLFADAAAGFNEIAGHIASLLYYLGFPYEVREADDPRFIAGRQAELIVRDAPVGVFGELHPAVLESWGIAVPCAAAEISLDKLGFLG